MEGLEPPQKPVLGYASAAPVPPRQSPYAIASLTVSGLSLLWFVLGANTKLLPFSAYKGHDIGTFASILATILSVAALCQPGRKRTTAGLALAFATTSLLIYIFLPPA